jgi:cell filamentation protein
VGGSGSVRISKGGNPFCFPENIEGQANQLFDDLRMSDYLRNLDSEPFSVNAAHFLAELNAIHAFREGNGRSQFTFLALLADFAGHQLNIEKLNPHEMLVAMIASFDGNERELAQIINDLVD